MLKLDLLYRAGMLLRVAFFPHHVGDHVIISETSVVNAAVVGFLCLYREELPL